MSDPVSEVATDFVWANGLRFHVATAGPDDGRLVLLLHGFPEFWYGWRHQIRPLAAAGFRVWAPDQRGYNLSDKPTGVQAYSIEHLAADAANMVKATGRDSSDSDRTHDCGGVVVWYLATHFPELVERAVILNAAHPHVMRRYLKTDPGQIARSWYAFFFQVPWLPERLLSSNHAALLTEALRRTSKRGAFSAPFVHRPKCSAWSPHKNQERSMFHHIKELQFDARVSQPDPRFASLLLEQFGGGNGELKAAMQYFVQSFSARQAYPDKYDLLIDVATEELSHLEIVGASITMLLNGVNGELKNAAEGNFLTRLMKGKQAKEEMIHQAMANPQFLVLSGGGPRLTDSQGIPWTGSFVNANGDLSVDLRSNIAAESRAKIVYEYLLQFTDDPHVQETLRFLMTREIAHLQMFAAALETIEPNFPPGVLQGDPRFTHAYYNMSDGAEVRGPWNEGQGPWGEGESWDYIADPVSQVVETKGQKHRLAAGTSHTDEEIEALNRELSDLRSEEIMASVPNGENAWSDSSREALGLSNASMTAAAGRRDAV